MNNSDINSVKKYRLGNQSTEYALETNYLGWFPEGENDWDNFLDPFETSRNKNKEITLVNSVKTEKVVLIMHQPIIKDAFPMEFFIEERAKNWHRFCIVSTKDNPLEKFIIPLH